MTVFVFSYWSFLDFWTSDFKIFFLSVFLNKNHSIKMFSELKFIYKWKSYVKKKNLKKKFLLFIIFFFFFYKSIDQYRLWIKSENRT